MCLTLETNIILTSDLIERWMQPKPISLCLRIKSAVIFNNFTWLFKSWSCITVNVLNSWELLLYTLCLGCKTSLLCFLTLVFNPNQLAGGWGEERVLGSENVLNAENDRHWHWWKGTVPVLTHFRLLVLSNVCPTLRNYFNIPWNLLWLLTATIATIKPPNLREGLRLLPVVLIYHQPYTFCIGKEQEVHFQQLEDRSVYCLK